MFELLEKKGNRRLGVLHTMHGPIYTPAFGPDATRGLIKNIAPHELFDLSGKTSAQEVNKLLDCHSGRSDSGDPESGSSLLQTTQIKSNNQILSQAQDDKTRLRSILDNKARRLNNEIQFLLSNTYHLRSFPGDKFIKEMGGLHEFMKWPLPILTDSGGFQVFSLIHGAKNLKGKVTDDGAYFNNPVTGERLELTPENAIDIQFNLGSDIIVVLDDCRHYQDQKELKKSVYRTIEWARRCKVRFEERLETYEFKGDQSQKVKRPLLFCVVQGGIDLELRKYCVDELVKIGFDGYGFGGWAINEKEYFPFEVMKFVAERLPEDKPRYAMGVGNPENMQRCIEYGYDMFDCVIPSRNARHGLAYTTEGDIKIQNAKFKMDKTSLDPNLESIATNYSKAYIHHLFKIQDALGGELLTIQNLKYFNSIMTNDFK
jgi:queuine tRNA-ribosyltransferase